MSSVVWEHQSFISGLSKILEKNFSSVSSISVNLNIASYFNMDTVIELGEAISRSTSVDELSLSYSSTDLLTTFLSHVTRNYKANILTLHCDSRVSASGMVIWLASMFKAVMHIIYPSSHIEDNSHFNSFNLTLEIVLTFFTLTEKLTASTYTDLKTTISALNGVTRFTLNHCKNSLALRNIVRNLPSNLLCLE